MRDHGEVTLTVDGKAKRNPTRLTVTARNQFDFRGVWLRGNLHCHVNGPERSAVAREWYRERGFDFLAATDHDVVTSFPPNEDDAFVCIRGSELSTPHVVALGITEAPPQAPPSGEGIAELVSAVEAQGGLTILAHPYWTGWRWRDLQVAAEAGITGFEVSNGLTRRLNGKGRSDQLWEMLLAEGYRPAAIGGDDAHALDDAAAGTVWTGLLASQRSTHAVMDAIRARRTYASEGPEIRSVRWEEPGVVVVESSPCVACHFCSEAGGAASVYADTPSAQAESFVLDLATAGYHIHNRLRIDLEDDRGRHAWSSAMDVTVSREEM